MSGFLFLKIIKIFQNFLKNERINFQKFFSEENILQKNKIPYYRDFIM